VQDFASCGAEPAHPTPRAESWDFGSDELLSVPWPANLPVSEDGYHPLEFYPTSQLDVSWGGGASSGQDFELRQADQHRGGRVSQSATRAVRRSPLQAAAAPSDSCR
jgi:hypothetical protein